MNNQIKTFDWKTKHITNEELSQKLFNAVSELFQFIANNKTKLSLLKVDSDPRSWNLKTSTKEIFVDKRPNYNYLYFTEKLKWETQLRFIKLETNCHFVAFELIGYFLKNSQIVCIDLRIHNNL